MKNSNYSNFRTTKKLNQTANQAKFNTNIQYEINYKDPLENIIIASINQYDLDLSDDDQTFNQQSQTELNRNPENDLGENDYLESGFKQIGKKSIKPLRMFKDKIDLNKENSEKHQRLKQLMRQNQQLKKKYHQSLNNNCRLQQFLKAIEFTFKNDQSNQKANETLLKAKKNLQRQEKQSKQYINYIWKRPKYNHMKEIKTYFIAEKEQQKHQVELYRRLQAENHRIFIESDLNKEEQENYEQYKNKIAAIMEVMIQQSLEKQQQYKKEKTIIGIHLLNKQIKLIRREVSRIEEKMKKKLLEKQGIEFQIQIIRNRNKEKNKKKAKETEKMLAELVKNKKIRILHLKKEFKEKTKTNQYISKWTRELKFQLEALKENHSTLKEQYQTQINKLSTEIEEWNRKYKAELVEDQVLNRTKKNNEFSSKLKHKEQTHQKDHKFKKQLEQKNNKTVKKRRDRQTSRQQINEIRKIIIFCILEHKQYPDSIQFIKKQIIQQKERLTYEQIKLSFLKILSLVRIHDAEVHIHKLLKYILEDQTTTLDSKETIEQKSISSKYCELILKNLLSSELNHSNLSFYKQQLYAFFDKNYENFRQNLWETSGKALNFSMTILELVFRKYIANESKIEAFIEYFQYELWKKFQSICMYKLIEFQLVCEDILQKRLVKDQKKLENIMNRTKLAMHSNSKDIR